MVNYETEPDYQAFAAKAGGVEGIFDLVGNSAAAPAAGVKRNGLFLRLVTDLTLQVSGAALMR